MKPEITLENPELCDGCPMLTDCSPMRRFNFRCKLYNIELGRFGPLDKIGRLEKCVKENGR